jgi:hypothetical protein
MVQQEVRRIVSTVFDRDSPSVDLVVMTRFKSSNGEANKAIEKIEAA